MATYPGLASTRESVSLDEDDLSDVEDEVFIRDGRNGYKFAEDRGVKRPLMAPRRKMPRPVAQMPNRVNFFKQICAPCCYLLLALTIVFGLVAVVGISVTLYPIPVDKFKTWVISKTSTPPVISKSLPCTNLKVTEMWNINLPHLTSESPFRSIDINADGTDDVIFGFGIGEDDFSQPDWFCPMFFGINSPCQGGLIALDGSTGKELWKRWLPHTIYTLFCTIDINGDGLRDCIASGKGGVMCAVNGKDGSILWNFYNQNDPRSLDIDHYAGSFVPDQDSDGMPDILAAHTFRKGRRSLGHLILISGKTGIELARLATPGDLETYYAPQHVVRFNGDNVILFGTGSPNSPGGLYMMPLHDIGNQKMSPKLLYEDTIKGVLSPALFVDITGDNIDDIVVAMFNSTVVAINGISLRQIWNFTIPNSETLSIPTPGYFNDDNVTDFLVKYQTGTGFPLYYYSQTIIIDGKTGTPIQDKPLIDSVGSQAGGLTISMESYGYDLFVFWMADCKGFEGNRDIYKFTASSTIKQQSRSDICKLRYNSSMVTKLYALNQYDEPPGILIYQSDNNTKTEYNNSNSLISEAELYIKAHPEVEFTPASTVDENSNNMDYDVNQDTYKSVQFKNGPSNFRHKDNGKGLIKEFSREKEQNDMNEEMNRPEQKFENSDYEQPSETWRPKYSQQYPYIPAVDPDYDTAIDEDGANMMAQSSNRDPRSKEEPSVNENSKQYPRNRDEPIVNENSNQDPRNRNEPKEESKITEAQTEIKYVENTTPRHYGIADYTNIHRARNRLLHDLNSLPNDILVETFIKNRERDIRNSKFEQRDLRTRESKNKEDKEFRDMLEEKKEKFELPLTLWDLESENEIRDRQNGYWRGKRSSSNNVLGIPKLTSVGILLKSANESTNSIDLVFSTYWLPPKFGAEILLKTDFNCIADKIKKAIASNDRNYIDKTTMENRFTRECLNERNAKVKNIQKDKTSEDSSSQNSPYYDKISQMSLGQMTVYKMRIECICDVQKIGEHCAKILQSDEQNWSSYLGHLGYGYYKKRN